MPKGGARSVSGPAPDPNALKASGEWTILPTKRTGRLPAWPLPKPTAREREVWKSLWVKPQAILWERNSQVELVALYVRGFVEAELPGAKAATRTWVRQMADDLMLTNVGLLRGRFRIAEVDEGVAKPTPAPVGRSSARDRLQVVKGGKTG